MSLLYHPEIYDDSKPVPSYWEATARPVAEPLADPGKPLDRDESCEVAIIGGGFTGLSAALHLARDHGIGARVLEAGHIGWGASGRNGGFCCLFSAKLSIAQLIARYGLEETQRFMAAQVEGIELNKDLAAQENFDFDLQGDGVWEVAHRPQAAASLQAYSAALTGHFGIPTQVYSADEFREIGHGGTEQFGALKIGVGYGLHPLKFSLGLAAAAQRHGAQLHPHSRVVAWEKQGDQHILHSTSGGSLRAKRVIMATNGFTRDDLHRSFKARVLPALSNIIVTRPLSEQELATESWHSPCPIFNSRTMLFYYRLLPDNRLLFGARGDLTGSPEDGVKMRAWITKRLYEVFPSWNGVEIDYFWRGLVGVTLRRTPAIGRDADDPSISFAYGFHGNGVNTAPWAGRKLARMIGASNSGDAQVPGVMAGLTGRFPPGRKLALRLAYMWYGLHDD